VASFAGVGSLAQHDSRFVRIDRVAMPLVVFLFVYVAILVLPALFLVSPGQSLFHWIALAAVIAATLAGRATARDDRPLGLPLARAPRELLVGTGVAFCVVGGAHVLLLVLGDVAMRRGSGFPFVEVALLQVPVVLHEELLFRGWAFQFLLRWSRGAAILISSLLFAALHLGNAAISPLPLINLFFGGVLLAYGYLLFRRLWVPIGAHFAWNLLSGPLLGYEVSGHGPAESVAVTVDRGARIMTGGDFGIEGSIVITALEAVAIVLVAVAAGRRNRAAADSS
jgi:hypothetical protein